MRHFLESLQLYNCIAGGVGTAYHRQCGIPQGCPLSMMSVALIMRPWVMLMRCHDVVCYILADDVLITVAGDCMYDTFVQALHASHEYRKSGVGPHSRCVGAPTSLHVLQGPSRLGRQGNSVHACLAMDFELSTAQLASSALYKLGLAANRQQETKKRVRKTVF